MKTSKKIRGSDILNWAEAARLDLPDHWDQIQSSLPASKIHEIDESNTTDVIPTEIGNIIRRRYLKDILVAIAVVTILSVTAGTLLIGRKNRAAQATSVTGQTTAAITTAPTTGSTEIPEIYLLFRQPIFMTEAGFISALAGDLSGMLNVESFGSEQVHQLLDDSGFRQSGYYYRLAYLPPLMHLELVTAPATGLYYTYSYDHKMASGDSIYDLTPDHLVTSFWIRGERSIAVLQGDIADGSLSDAYREGFYIRQDQIISDGISSMKYHINWMQGGEWFGASFPSGIGMEKAFDLCQMERVTLPVHDRITTSTETHTTEDITLAFEADPAVFAVEEEEIRLGITNGSDDTYTVFDAQYIQKFDKEDDAWHLVMQIDSTPSTTQMEIRSGEAGHMIVRLDGWTTKAEPGQYRIWVDGFAQSFEFELVE